MVWDDVGGDIPVDTELFRIYSACKEEPWILFVRSSEYILSVNHVLLRVVIWILMPRERVLVAWRAHPKFWPSSKTVTCRRVSRRNTDMEKRSVRNGLAKGSSRQAWC